MSHWVWLPLPARKHFLNLRGEPSEALEDTWCRQQALCRERRSGTAEPGAPASVCLLVDVTEEEGT